MELIRFLGSCLVIYLLLSLTEWAVRGSDRPAIVRFRRRVLRWPEPLKDAWSIEQHARYLVQKIARERAAVHALNVAGARPTKVYSIGGVNFLDDAQQREYRQLDYRVAAAKRLTNYALEDLRLVLGLPEHPTQAECAGWGEAP